MKPQQSKYFGVGRKSTKKRNGKEYRNAPSLIEASKQFMGERKDFSTNCTETTRHLYD